MSNKALHIESPEGELAFCVTRNQSVGTGEQMLEDARRISKTPDKAEWSRSDQSNGRKQDRRQIDQ